MKNNSWKDIWQEGSIDQEMSQISREYTYTEIFDKYFKKNKKILEAGCGYGRYCFYLEKKGVRCFGIEIEKNALEVGKRYAKKNQLKSKLILGDVKKLPFEDNIFDGYMSLGVIEHFYSLNDIQKAFDEAYRVLKKGGYAFFSVPNPYAVTFWVPKITGKEKVYHRSIHKKHLKKFAQASGFQIISLRYRDFIHPMHTLKVWITKKDTNDSYNLYKKTFKDFENYPVIQNFCSGLHMLIKK